MKLKAHHLLVFAGIIVVISGQLVPLSIQTDNLVVASFPDGTYSEPNAVTVGSSFVPTIVTTEYYGGEYDSSPLIRLEINGVNVDYSEQLEDFNYVKYSESRHGYFLDDPWTVPTLGVGSVLKFSFIQTKYYPDQTILEAYIKTHSVGGFFQVNGESDEVIINVTSATLNIEFLPVEQPQMITEVKVYVSKGEQTIHTVFLTETVDDVKWQTTYTLPSRGTYTLEGCFYVGSTESKVTTIIVVYGESSSWNRVVLSVFGVSLFAVGAVLWVKQRRERVS